MWFLDLVFGIFIDFKGLYILFILFIFYKTG